MVDSGTADGGTVGSGTVGGGTVDGGTGTVLGARDHARAQAAGAGAVTTRPTIPATAATDLPPGVEGADVVWDETLGLGGYAARVLRRGTHLRLTDLDG